MKAMVLTHVGPIANRPLQLQDVPTPQPRAGEVRVKITVCGVCHTDLDEAEGRLAARLPVIPGHQIVGHVDALGLAASRFQRGDRVGIAWIYSADGTCEFCRAGNENLCPQFRGTGCDADGGYAEYVVAPPGLRVPDSPAVYRCASSAAALCRRNRLPGVAADELEGRPSPRPLRLRRLGPHPDPGRQAQVPARTGLRLHAVRADGAPGNGQEAGRRLGRRHGRRSPCNLHAAIDFTPTWGPIVEALRVLAPGGRLVVNAIRKEDRDKDALLHLDYATHLWREKEIKSTANVTRQDAREFLPLAAEIPIRPQVQEFPLEQANEALQLVKEGKTQGAAVLRISKSAS